MYNYNNDKDTSILNATEPTYNDNYLILRSEVVSAIQSLKNGKSPGVDNITGELLKSGGENMISVITNVYNKITNFGGWPIVWTKIFRRKDITLTQNRVIRICIQNTPVPPIAGYF